MRVHPNVSMAVGVGLLMLAAWVAAWQIASAVPYQGIHPAVGSDPVLYGGGEP